MNFEGWTVTESTHGMDCHKCEWAAEAGVDFAVVRGSVGTTYTIQTSSATHSATAVRDIEGASR